MIPGGSHSPGGSGFRQAKWTILITWRISTSIGGLCTPLPVPSRLHGDKNLVLNGSIEYDLILPQRTILRIPDDVNLPLTSNREKVKRDIGDIIGLKVSVEYTFFKGLSASLLYHFEAKLEDKVKGSPGFNYKSVEEETATRSHV